MFSIWRANTVVFVFQLALGSAWFAETKSIGGSAGMVTFVTFLLLSGLGGKMVIDELHEVLLPAFFAVWAFVFQSLDWQYGIFMALVVAVMMSYYVASVGKRYRSEPWSLVFLAALPLGVGTVLGGLALLYLHLRATANEPIA